MIHEYALDPQVLSSWSNFRFFVSQFGIEHGRLISRFPRDWKRMVYEAVENTSAIEKLRMVEGLRTIDPKLYANSSRSYSGQQSWFSNAVLSDSQIPFRLIITTAANASGTRILDAAFVDETHPEWRADSIPVARNARALGQAAHVLIRCSREVLFIDPHFSSAARHLRPLVEFLRTVSLNGSCRRLEYHLLADQSGTADFFEAKLNSFHHVKRELAQKTIRFLRWRPRQDGEAFHARYILTDLGGLTFEHGLDEGDDGETTDIGRLSAEAHRIRLASFSPTTASHDLVDAWELGATGARRINLDANGAWFPPS